MNAFDSIWKIPLTLFELNERGKQTLAEHLEIEFIEIGPNFLKASMPVDHRTLQPLGSLNGGASAAFAETIASTAANCCVDLQKEACLGLDLNINHIRQVKSGKVIGTATPLHLGRTTQVWEIKIVSEQQKLIAIARLTMAIVKR